MDISRSKAVQSQYIIFRYLSCIMIRETIMILLHSVRVLHRDWLVVGGLDTKMSIFMLPPCFYTQNTQFSMFFSAVVVGGVSECWVRPPTVGKTLLGI